MIVGLHHTHGVHDHSKTTPKNIVSTPGANFMSIDIKNFYFHTPMPRYEYMRLKLSDLPDDVIRHYNLENIVTKDGYIYTELSIGMYGLPAAGILAQQLLENSLNKEGYS